MTWDHVRKTPIRRRKTPALCPFAQEICTKRQFKSRTPQGRRENEGRDSFEKASAALDTVFYFS